METDIVIDALRQIPVGRLCALSQKLRGEADPVLGLLGALVHREVNFRNGLAAPPVSFNLSGLSEEELLASGHGACSAAEFLNDKATCWLFICLARVCLEAARAVRCAKATDIPVN